VTLEHRYYGESQPFSDEEGGWSNENLKWLNSTYALRDIADFIDFRNSQMTGTHKWVIIGGSYPGALSAWFKHRYPTKVAASWSSSGVINAITDYTGFDFDVYLTTLDSGIECSDAIRNTTFKMDDVFINGSYQDKVDLINYFGSNNTNLTHGEFMQFVSDTFAGLVQTAQRLQLCAIVTSDAYLNDTQAGFKSLAEQTGMSLEDYAIESMRNTTIDSSKNMRQWNHQVCTEFGYF